MLCNGLQYIVHCLALLKLTALLFHCFWHWPKGWFLMLERYLSHSSVTTSTANWLANVEVFMWFSRLNAAWVMGTSRFLDYPLFVIILPTFPLHYQRLESSLYIYLQKYDIITSLHGICIDITNLCSHHFHFLCRSVFCLETFHLLCYCLDQFIGFFEENFNFQILVYIGS